MRHKIEIHQTEEKRRRQFPKTLILRQLGLDLVFHWALQEPRYSFKVSEEIVWMDFILKWKIYEGRHQNELENCKEWLGELHRLDLDNQWQAWRINKASKGPLGTLLLQVYGLWCDGMRYNVGTGVATTQKSIWQCSKLRKVKLVLGLHNWKQNENTMEWSRQILHNKCNIRIRMAIL